MKYNTQRPYAAVYAIVQNDKKEIAFVLRSNTAWMNGYYGLPAGKTEKSESSIVGVIREAKEEIGIDVKSQHVHHAITAHRHSTEENDDAMDWIDIFFEITKWEGEPYNAEPQVHSEMAWLDPHNLPDNVIPSLKATIDAWAKGEKYYEYGWK